MSVDARRFEAAVADARVRLADEPDAASEILRAALDLWRGSALQDFAFDDFASAEIARLEELRLQAVETRIEADLRRGLAGELVVELETLVYQHPLREGPVVQLMHALYRAGRQAEALRAFQRFRRGLGEELGIEPSPELCRLEEQILLHDPRLHSFVRRTSGRRRRRPSSTRSRVCMPSARPTPKTSSAAIASSPRWSGASAAVRNWSLLSARVVRASRASCAPA